MEWLAGGGRGVSRIFVRREGISRYSCHLSVELVVNYSRHSSPGELFVNSTFQNNLMGWINACILSIAQGFRMFKKEDLKLRFWHIFASYFNFEILTAIATLKAWEASATSIQVKPKTQYISYKAKTTNGNTLRWFPPLPRLIATLAFDFTAKGRVTLWVNVLCIFIEYAEQYRQDSTGLNRQ